MNIYKMLKAIVIASFILTIPILALSCQGSPIQSFNNIEPSEGLNKTTPAPSVAPIEPSVAPMQNITPDLKLVEYTGKVTHIFFHPLLAYPEMAFDGDSMSKGFDDWFVTVSEFNKIIDSLYSKNYILIDINSLYEIKTENNLTKITKKKLMLPENKIPLILSIDDMNYYKYMIGNGTISKLVLDTNGNIAAYSKNIKGEDVIAYNNEIVPILDSFVKNHPDFSLNGAKGTIALTGYQGVLGYRTDFDTPDNAKERDEVLKVIAKLKAEGWNFACHGYGHLDANKQPYNTIVKDTLKWKKEVESLIGQTNVYIYPFGSSLKSEDPKYKFLINSGFKILCGVGPGLNERLYGNSVAMDRRHIDGISLRQQRSHYLDLFDSNKILDPERPAIKK